MTTYFFTLKIGAEERKMGFEAPDKNTAWGLAEAWADIESKGKKWILYERREKD